MSRSPMLVLIFLLTLCSLLRAQTQENYADTIPADTLYDPEYYSDDDVKSIKEYLDPDEIKKADRADILADIGTYPIYRFGRSNIGTISIEGDLGHFYEPASKTIMVGLDITSMVFTAEKKQKQEHKTINEYEEEL